MDRYYIIFRVYLFTFLFDRDQSVQRHARKLPATSLVTASKQQKKLLVHMSAQITLPITPANTPDSVMLPVFKGKCGQLSPSERAVLVPLELLPEQIHCEWALQESEHEKVYWLLCDGHRYNGQCFCGSCNVLFNGIGGNFRAHIRKHEGRANSWSTEQKEKAFFLLLVRHNLAFATIRDPMVRILCPGMTYLRLLSLLDETAASVKSTIAAEIQGRDLCIMVDGWSDMSLRRYLGIAVSFYNPVSHEQNYRFLSLDYGKEGHGAASQEKAVRKCLTSFHVEPMRVFALCSDSASVNTALADRMSLSWIPCCCHLWNLVVHTFLDNCPASFHKVLSNINSLRKKTVWVEYLANNGSPVRNLMGYIETRWCSVCMCVESFIRLKGYILSFQYINKLDLFTGEDFELVGNVQNILSRFQEANVMLMGADRAEGLATVYEVINAMYMVLESASHKESPFQNACAIALREIECRFFNRESRFCCRLLFAGILNVAHTIQPYLEKCCAEVLTILASEVNFFTGATAPSSPSECMFDDRYCDARSLQDMINDSPVSSERNPEVCDEISRFMAKRPHLVRAKFTLFWERCDSFPHLRMFAMHLRAFPTNTSHLESTFSMARRVLAWDRMRLTGDHASKLCLLSANKETTQRVLGLETPASFSLDELGENWLVSSEQTNDYISDEEN